MSTCTPTPRQQPAPFFSLFEGDGDVRALPRRARRRDARDDEDVRGGVVRHRLGVDERSVGVQGDI